MNRFSTQCLLIVLAFVLPLQAQTSIPAFTIEPNDLMLTRPAQNGTYFDKVGRRFAVLGNEGGTFEAWAYPLKLVRNVEFSVFLGTSTEPVPARDMVRRIEVTPELTTLTFTYQSFTLKAHFLTPIDQPGAYVLLDLDSTEPLSIVCSFIPVLQPMWPAGIGGQSARWIEELKAYQISEPTRKNNAFIGSPAASGMSYTPAHMLSDRPNQFRIIVDKPADLRGRFIPIVVAGGRGSRDSIRAIYEGLLTTSEKHYRAAIDHYRVLRASTVQLSTPNNEINLAYEWAKVAYDNLFVNNPDLGLGMVAGLGASGTSGRPGFGWFFGGDAFINSFSLNAAGATSAVRDALLFTHRWQRADGKMAHELSQAAAYIDWWKDYPYGYIHGDTSPFYVCAVWDYFRYTADSAFVREHWTVIRKAYDWSMATDENGDGLMDNKKAGLGALEYGPLTDIQSDVYTGAVWVRAATAMPTLARVVGDTVFAHTAERYAMNAAQSFDKKFWDERNQQYAYAFTPRGQLVDIVSPWSSVGLMWELGEPSRSVRSLIKLNSAELATDWGIRSISIKSKYYEPLNYNYGAVWPFLSSWVATAQFKHHLAMQGYNTLMASVRHTFDNGLGVITEVFSGSHNVWPQEAVAHQGFSSASVILPLMRGLVGLEVNAPERMLHFAPHLPADWDRLSAQNIRVGAATIGLEYSRTRTKATLKIKTTDGDGTTIVFAPAFGIGTGIGKARIDGKETAYRLIVSSQTVQPLLQFPVGPETNIELEIIPSVELLPPPVWTSTGSTNRSLKILATSFKEKQLKVTFEGLSNTPYELTIMNDDLLQSVDGCRRDGRKLYLTMPNGPAGEFVRSEFTITVR